MKNHIVKVSFPLPQDLFEELSDLENGKYPTMTSYIRAITHEHLTNLIVEKERLRETKLNNKERMYKDVLG